MKSLSRGLLIAFEGIDGSGKSTLAQTVVTYFATHGYPVVFTKEPGGSPLGALLRPLLQEQSVALCPQAEFLLFAADRAQHFNDVIIPALHNKKMVISDRLADSSLVYQGYGRGLDITMLTTINTWVMHNCKPDLTLYLKVSLQTACERLKKRSNRLTSFEQDQLFFQKLVEGFDTVYSDRSDVITLDAEQSQDTLFAQALQHINQWLNTNLL